MARFLLLLTALAVGGFSRPLRRPGPRLTRPTASSRMALETLPGGLSIAEAVGMRIESLFVAAPMAVAMVATRSSSSIPQVVELARLKKPSVVAAKWGARVFFGDAVVYLSRAGYHLRRGHSFACWSELVPLLLQNLTCFAVLRFSDGTDGSDGGVCWSDYERTPGTKEGEKGSCRPKKKKSKSSE